MIMESWIKLHRSALDPESSFFRLTPKQQALFVHILIRANFKSHIWTDSYKGIDVPVARGELITSREKIKSWFPGKAGLSCQEIRTALKRMEKLGMLTIETTNNYTHIKVCQYSKYQDKFEAGNQQANQQPPKKQPRPKQEPTTIKEIQESKKNEEKETKKKSSSLSSKSLLKSSEGRVVHHFYQKLSERAYTKATLNQAWINEQLDTAKQFMADTETPEETVINAINWFLMEAFWKDKFNRLSQLVKNWHQYEQQKTTKNKNNKKTNRFERLLTGKKIRNIYEPETVLLSKDYDFDPRGYLGQPGLIPKAGGEALRAEDYKAVIN